METTTPKPEADPYRYRCNRCHRPMIALTAGQDGCCMGACECGGLIEAHPDNFRTFQIGDTVLCVDDSAGFNRLRAGSTYVVEANFDGSPTVMVNGSSHSLERFAPLHDEPHPALYPFEVTLPVLAGEFIVPILPADLGSLRPRFYRTFYCREERQAGDEEGYLRLAAVFQRRSGEYAPVKNPYTLALLREALGL